MNIELLPHQLAFVTSKAPHPAICGGLGCCHPDTKIWTERGLIRIADILEPIRVLSWNEKSQKFQLSLSGGAFPKGEANLCRIATKRAEFVSAGHHRIFSSSHTFEQVADLSLQDSISVASLALLLTIRVFGLRWLPSSADHSCQKLSSLMGCYADAARQYGQQLLTSQESCQANPQSLAGAHKSRHTRGLGAFLRLGGLVVRALRHSRLGQSFDRLQMLGCARHNVELAAGAGGRTFSLCAGRISLSRQLLQQFLLTSLRRHTGQILKTHDHSFTKPFGIESDSIIAVSVGERKEVYYDMQVMDTNNYVDEYGVIHHNSGKSAAATMRVILLMLADKGINTLIGMPTYDLLRLRAMPGVEQDLQKIGVPFSVNKSEFSITIIGYGNIYFRSYDRPERWVAFEVAHTILDELDTLPKEKAALVWRKANERTRQKCKSINTIGNVTTPDQGINGFTYQKWGKDPQAGYELIKASTLDNFYLPAGYVDQIMANYDPLMRDAYLRGEFVSFTQNKVYHFFTRARHHSDRVIQAGDRLNIALDFNVGGTVATVWIIDGKKPIAVDEFVSHDTRDFVNNMARYKAHHCVVYPDASGGASRTNAAASDIDIIRKGGFAVDAPAANPLIRDRINRVNALFANDEIAINTLKCPELTFALESQGYTIKGEPEKYDTHPAIDDYNDGMGYFLHRKFPIRAAVQGLAWG